MTNSVQQIIMFEDNVKRTYSSLQLTKEELKKKRQMLKDAFQQDAEYYGFEEKIKELKRAQNVVKKRIANTSGVFGIRQEVEELAAEVKDMQMTLSDYLYTYSENTKNSSIELAGQTHRIVRNFKVQKKKV